MWVLPRSHAGRRGRVADPRCTSRRQCFRSCSSRPPAQGWSRPCTRTVTAPCMRGWPVDPLKEWLALKGAVTRGSDPAAGATYAGRLASDTGLTLPAALRAITANSSYELHAEHEVGSLEVGKLADFIVLDRNVFRIPPRQIADVKILLTVVGGQAVYGAPPFAQAD